MNRNSQLVKLQGLRNSLMNRYKKPAPTKEDAINKNVACHETMANYHNYVEQLDGSWMCACGVKLNQSIKK